MTETEPNETEDRVLVRFAEYEVQRYLAAVKLSDEQHTSAFKWLYASLLAINGALALAALNSDSIQPIYKPIPMGLAFVGVCAALMIAKLAQSTSVAPERAINSLINYWATVAEYKTRFPEKENEFNEALRVANQPSIWVERMGWVSAVSFFLCAVSLGVLVVLGNVAPINKPSPACQYTCK